MTLGFGQWLVDYLETWQNLVNLSVEFWSEAALLAAARLRSNDGKRHDHRNRQGENAHVDLMGAASEVLLYRMLLRHFEKTGNGKSSLEYMRKHLFVSEGGGSAATVDLEISDEVDSYSYDAKSFDFSPNKKFFAINENKHERLANFRPTYFCLLCPALAKKAYVALVPYDDVASPWQSKVLGNYQPPDPAMVLQIDAFCRRYLGLSRNECENEVSNLHSVEDVRSETSVHGKGARRIAESAPPVAELLAADDNTLEVTLNRIIPVRGI